jgi:hypothetical protein
MYRSQVLRYLNKLTSTWSSTDHVNWSSPFLKYSSKYLGKFHSTGLTDQYLIKYWSVHHSTDGAHIHGSATITLIGQVWTLIVHQVFWTFEQILCVFVWMPRFSKEDAKETRHSGCGDAIGCLPMWSTVKGCCRSTAKLLPSTAVNQFPWNRSIHISSERLNHRPTTSQCPSSSTSMKYSKSIQAPVLVMTPIAKTLFKISTMILHFIVTRLCLFTSRLSLSFDSVERWTWISEASNTYLVLCMIFFRCPTDFLVHYLVCFGKLALYPPDASAAIVVNAWQVASQGSRISVRRSRSDMVHAMFFNSLSTGMTLIKQFVLLVHSPSTVFSVVSSSLIRSTWIVPFWSRCTPHLLLLQLLNLLSFVKIWTSSRMLGSNVVSRSIILLFIRVVVVPYPLSLLLCILLVCHILICVLLNCCSFSQLHRWALPSQRFFHATSALCRRACLFYKVRSRDWTTSFVSLIRMCSHFSLFLCLP